MTKSDQRYRFAQKSRNDGIRPVSRGVLDGIKEESQVYSGLREGGLIKDTGGERLLAP